MSQGVSFNTDVAVNQILVVDSSSDHIFSYDIDGISATSNEAAATTWEESEDMNNPPTGLTATTNSNSQITLSWTEPTGESNIGGYLIERESPTGNGFAEIVSSTGSTTTTYTNSALDAKTEYNYRIAALSTGQTGVTYDSESSFDFINNNNSDLAYHDNKFWALRGANDDKVYAYNTDGTRDATLDFDLDAAHITPDGITYYDNKFWIIDNSDDKVFAYNTDGTRAATSDFDLDAANLNPKGIIYHDSKFWVNDLSGNKVYVHNTDGTRAAASDFDLDTSNRNSFGITYHDSKFWVTDNIDDKVYAYNTDGTRAAASDFNLDATHNNAWGVTQYNNQLWIIQATDKVYAYTLPAAASTSDYSNEAAATTWGSPDPITTLTATSTDSAITLSWAAPATNGYAITGYKLERAIDTTGTPAYADLLPVSAAALSYNDSTAEHNITYIYRISANSGPTGGYSDTTTSNTIMLQPLPLASAPTNLSATANSKTQITLSWTEPASSNQITGYLIERESPTGNGFAEIVSSTGSTTVTYVNSALDAKTEYNYRVAVIDAAGTSGYSNQAAATTWGSPDTVATLTATSTDSAITLSWAAPATYGYPITGYKLERAVNAVTPSYADLLPVSAAALSYNDSTAEHNITYIYRISANSGIVGGYSDTTTSNTIMLQQPAPSTITTVSATANSETQITLSWTAPAAAENITGYLIERESPTGNGFAEIISNTGSSTNSYIDTSLTTKTEYNYRIKAISTTGTSGYSNQAATTTWGVPDTPAAPAATATENNITISWVAPGIDGYTITGYKIERAADGNTATILTTAPTATSTSYIDTTATADVTYTYTVFANSSYGYSAASPASAGIMLLPSTGPTTLSATANSETQITLSWTEPAAGAADGYLIERESPAGNGWAEIESNTGSSSTSYTDNTLTTKTEYNYRVAAIITAAAATTYDSTSDFNLDAANPSPTGIIYHNAKFWIVDYAEHKVYAHNTDGTRAAASDFDLDAANTTPTGITYYDNKFWVTDIDDDKVFAYNTDGTRAAASDFNLDAANTSPYGITYYDSKFWIADYTEDKVFAYNTDGTRAATSDFNLDAANPGPYGITYYDSKFWIIDFADDKVFAYNTDGTRAAASDFDFNAANTDSAGITYYDNKFWVTDNTDDKVYAYATAAATTSTYSNQAATTTWGVPDQPAAPTATATENNITISWVAPATYGYTITGYKIERAADGNTATILTTAPTATSTSYIDTTATADVTYTYTVFANSSYGYSAASPASAGIMLLPSTTPTVLSAAPNSNSQITLSWTAPASGAADGYLIERESPAGNGWAEIESNTGSSSTSYTDTGLQNPKTEYNYRVAAVMEAGTGNDLITNFSINSANSDSFGITYYDNKFWVVDWADNYVYVYDTDGTRAAASDFNLATSEDNTSPYGITYHDNKFWIVDTTDNKVFAYNTDGTRAAASDFDLDDDNTSPGGITFLDNKFWVADWSGTEKVYAYNTDGTRAAASDFNLANQLNTPMGIAALDGKLWITNNSNDKVYAYNTDGTRDRFYDFDLYSANGNPDGITSYNNKLYVSDNADTEIYIYNIAHLSGYSNEAAATTWGSPDPITTLTATSTDTAITLSWVAPATNGYAITGYKLERATPTSTSTYTTISDVISSSATSWTDPTTLLQDTTYFYRISANSGIVGGYSDTTISNSIILLPEPPQATPADLTATPNSDSQITLSWTAALDSDEITGYLIERESPEGNGFAQLIANTGSSTNSYIDTSLTTKTEYNYRIKAINLGGTSGYSNEAATTTWGVPDQPATPTTTTTQTTITINWIAPAIDGYPIIGYKLERAVSDVTPSYTTLSDTISSTTTSYTDNAITADTTYLYRISAESSYGFSAASTAASVLSRSSSPIITLVDDCNHTCTTQLNIEWSFTIPSTETLSYYKLERESPTGSSTFTHIAGQTITLNKYYNNTGLIAGQEYNYRISAVLSNYETDPSNEYEYSPHKLPAPITDLTSSKTTLSSVLLAWTEPETYSHTHCYLINYTTPTGNPLTTIDPCTASTATIYEVLGLNFDMAHSFRVGVVTPHGTSAGSNIVDSTSNVFTVGDLTIETGSNPETIDVFFERNDIDDSTVEIDVRYPAAIDDFGCNVTQQFSQTDTMYDDLTAEPYAIDTDYVQSSFTINDPQNEVYSFDCASETTPEINGKYVVTQTSFPFIEQANNFRLGEIIPTTGDFGGLDLITLIVIIVSMVGFSSKNPAAGIIISVMILGATSFFELITIPTTVIGALVLVVVLAVIVTVKR